MGIDVDNDGTVRFNGHHEHLLNTSTGKNPTVKVIKGLKIHSVFRRVRRPDDLQDGNPFIYALKNKKGFKIDRRELWRFRSNFIDILERAIQDIEADIVVPMPSGHKIASYLAYKVSKYHPEKPIVLHALRKRTVGEMLEAYKDQVPKAGPYKTREYKDQIRRWSKMPLGTLVSMKDVRVRTFFRPLALVEDGTDLAGKRVLLVDDLLSSGSTLKCAESLVEEKNAVGVCGLCLLSGLS